MPVPCSLQGHEDLRQDERVVLSSCAAALNLMPCHATPCHHHTQGHEDLRQDERVMQLFGLVNTMLANDRTTAERDLSIARYAVIPLSPNSGLIGWVPNCDTLHALIREYRCVWVVCVGKCGSCGVGCKCGQVW